MRKYYIREKIMASFNKVVLVGNLCKDVEVRTVGATSVAQIRLAINEIFTSKSGEKVEKTVFVDVEAWDRLADNCAKMVGRGCSVLIEGRLQMDEWDDKETGKKRSKIKVRADRVVFLTFKDGVRGEESGGQADAGNVPGIKPPGAVRDTPFDEDPPF